MNPVALVGGSLSGGFFALDGAPVLHQEMESLRPGQEGDDDDDQRNAVHQITLVECEPQTAEARTPDRGQQQSDARGEETARGVLSEKARHDRQTEHADREQLARPEHQGDVAERRACDDEDQSARDAADHPRVEGDAQRLARESVPGHGVAVETVTADAPVPGVRIRMAGMELPYSTPE